MTLNRETIGLVLLVEREIMEEMKHYQLCIDPEEFQFFIDVLYERLCRR